MEEMTCIAIIVAKAGQEDNLKDLLQNLIEPTRNEPGCISYDMYQGHKEPRLFTMVEKFKDEAAFKEHMNQPYLVDFKEKSEALIDAFSANLYKMVEKSV